MTCAPEGTGSGEPDPAAAVSFWLMENIGGSMILNPAIDSRKGAKNAKKTESRVSEATHRSGDGHGTAS
jgi:hypothetical protein